MRCRRPTSTGEGPPGSRSTPRPTRCASGCNFDRTGTPNRGHIHTGVAGVNGGIVVPLFELIGVPADPLNDELERDRGTTAV